MNCQIIKDLLPLYTDGCCSDETRAVVEEHLTECAGCKATLEAMSRTIDMENERIQTVSAKNPVGLFKASILQSALLFLSFLLLTIGVYLESASPYGVGNGVYAFALIVPSSGFMLSLPNWFFVRQYKSRRAFAVWSAVIFALVTAFAGILTIFHYSNYSTVGLQTGAELPFGCFAAGAALSLIFTVVSALSANHYAKLIGKE